MRKRTALLTCLLSVFLFGYSQNERKNLEKAEYTFYKEDFAKAIQLYDAILETNKKNDQAQYHKLIATHLTSGRGQSLQELLSFESKKATKDKFYHYWMGRIYLARYEFEKAQNHFNQFLHMNEFKSAEILNEVDALIDQINVAQAHYSIENSYVLNQLDYPINSVHDDLSPGFYKNQNEVIFASSRPYTGIKKSSKEFLIFHSHKASQGWSQPKALSTFGALPKKVAMVEVVNEEGKLFALRHGHGAGTDLYYSTPDNNGWSTPKEFDAEINASILNSDFYINDTEDKILFSSVSKDSGTLDIFETYKGSDGLWSVPQRIKGAVNSEWDEDSPFLSKDGNTLFFSSNNPNSMGGYDVFSSTYNSKTSSWAEPKNLGHPINTIDDEINYRLNSDGISGFLSSNRLYTLGNYDIYYFHKKDRMVLYGQVTINGNQASSNLSITLNSVGSDQISMAKVDKEGRYLIELPANQSFQLKVDENGKTIHDAEVNTEVSTENVSLRHDVRVELEIPENEMTIVRSEVVPENEKTFKKIVDIKHTDLYSNLKYSNIYFEEKSTKIKVKYGNIIEGLVAQLSSDPSIKIEISGFTDDRESPDNAASLSVIRANALKYLLVDNGIDANRVFVKGYADAKPLASNDDEPDGRELNRRIEVAVLR